MNKKEIVIYQKQNGAIELQGDLSHETIWASQTQIADIFDIDRSVATRHIGNILKNKEIDEKRNVQKIHIAKSDKPVSLYSLDMILAVGYRTNSAKAITFRQWATKILRQHITKGYTINPRRVRQNYNQFIQAVENIKALLPKGEGKINADDALELIKLFADTWLSLDAYDKDKLAISGSTKKEVELTAFELVDALENFKNILLKKGEASDLFGIENNKGNIEGIVGNVMQTYEKKLLYPTIEEKAAHLLYFMIKNHPFVDGNKRSGAFAFIWFLKKANLLDKDRITPSALTALALLIAESNPKNKERMIRLVLQLLRK